VAGYTDLVLGDETRIGASLAAVGSVAATVAGVLILLGRRPMREALLAAASADDFRRPPDLPRR
jgi:hypothetical protein